MTKEVRTRFAPSPTGYMHIGNLRTAIFEYLVAKINGGKFILRIEDTDQARRVDGAVEVIYSTLKTIGIKHDEGPDIGGDYGPYVQSERKDLYLPFARKLIESKDAYYCFCSKDRLDALRSKAESEGIQFKYDRHCLSLTEDEIQNNLNAGIEFVIRQKAPDSGTTTYHDEVYGDITFNNEILEDQILIKSDGFPTYNFANVIDDHTMNITHVVRGSEYLSSTPKFVNLYKAFGWDVPIFVHLPLIVKKDGSKISKRNGDAMFGDLISAGYLPEAVLNYIAMLGWSPGDEREFFTLSELEHEFTVKGISKSPSTLDYEKLKWMNGEYIRKLSLQDFTDLSRPWIENGLSGKRLNIEAIAQMLQKRTEILSDIPSSIDFLVNIDEIQPDLYFHKKMKSSAETAVRYLPVIKEELVKLEKWKHDDIYESLVKVAESNETKNGTVMWPLRVALTGKPVTPGGAVEVAEILGKEETLNRIDSAISQLEVNNG